jgi:Phosphodiester glycosidase
MELGTATRHALAPRKNHPPERYGGGVLRRMRRIALAAALLTLLPAAYSYLHTIVEPSNSSLGVRSVEWLREHGAAGLVSQIESTYYSLTAPSKGGATLRALPQVGYGAAAAARAQRLQAQRLAAASYRPPRVAPLIHPALGGEGVWRATRPGLGTGAPLLITTLRNQPEYPRVVAGLAWIDTKRTTVTLNPGRQEPSVSIPRGSMDVPQARRGKLLATFNSGFKLSDSRGGFALNGHTYATMQNGQATIVGYSDGRVDVIDWQYGPRAPSSVTFARQNLPLLVNRGRPSPNLESSEWGATVGNAVLVWRSGIGVDRHGNLIYAAGEEQSVGSLADTLAHAGAVRAMELDINSYWVSFITYGAPGANAPVNLLSGMERPASRYLTPDDRDFFAVYSR